MRKSEKQAGAAKPGRKSPAAAGKVRVSTQISRSDKAEIDSLNLGHEKNDVLLRRVIWAGMTAIKNGTSYATPAPPTGHAVSDLVLVHAASEVSKEGIDRLERRLDRLEAAVGALVGTVEKLETVLTKLNSNLAEQ